MKTIIYILVFSLAFADCYFFLPYLRAETLAAMALIVYCFFYKKDSKENINFNSNKNSKKKLIIAASLFIGYMTLIDISRMQIHETIGSVFTDIVIIAFFYYFEKIENNFAAIYIYIVLYVIYNALFCFDQLLGGDMTVGKIFSFTNFIFAERLYMGETTQGIRISGGYNYCITLNIYLGCILFFLIFMRSYKHLYLNILLLLLVLFFQFETMTRSALIAMPIAFYIGYLANSYKDSGTLILKILLICFVIIVGLFIIKPLVNSDNPSNRMTDFRDGSSINRYQVNIYACVGTFMNSPYTGIPRDEMIAYDSIMDGYEKIGLILQDTFTPIVTHHDEPAFYFRYYGFIGLFLYVSLYYSVFRYIVSSNKRVEIKQALIAMVVYFFLYNLMHNGKIISCFPVWLFLATNSVDHYEEIKPADE